MTNNAIGQLTRKEERMQKLLQWTPWCAWLLLTIAPPLFFLFFYFTAVEDAAVYMLLALTSMALGSASGLIVAIALLFYRRQWTARLRERLAADGITAREIPFFTSELTGLERRVLKQMKSHSPLLADAYCETLALRLNATRIVSKANRQLQTVRQQINRASRITGADASTLLKELELDQSRLQTLQDAGRRNLAEVETRLQTIEAAATRGAGWPEANLVRQRLDEGTSHPPLALETARLEQQAREDVESEMREVKRQP
jgi:hypothetical protein